MPKCGEAQHAQPKIEELRRLLMITATQLMITILMEMYLKMGQKKELLSEVLRERRRSDDRTLGASRPLRTLHDELVT